MKHNRIVHVKIGYITKQNFHPWFDASISENSFNRANQTRSIFGSNQESTDRKLGSNVRFWCIVLPFTWAVNVVHSNKGVTLATFAKNQERVEIRKYSEKKTSNNNQNLFTTDIRINFRLFNSRNLESNCQFYFYLIKLFSNVFCSEFYTKTFLFDSYFISDSDLCFRAKICFRCLSEIKIKKHKSRW